MRKNWWKISLGGFFLFLGEWEEEGKLRVSQENIPLAFSRDEENWLQPRVLSTIFIFFLCVLVGTFLQYFSFPSLALPLNIFWSIFSARCLFFFSQIPRRLSSIFHFSAAKRGKIWMKQRWWGMNGIFVVKKWKIKKLNIAFVELAATSWR